jgi:transcriptional regulator with XRE-family HTH domain
VAPRSGFSSRPSLLSKNLRRLRHRANLTPGQLAERLGVTCHAIQAWETGQRALRKGWDFRLAEALGCSVTDLREAGSAARIRRWRRAWVNLTAAAAKTPSPLRNKD